jgi:STE24 endopeptidase
VCLIVLVVTGGSSMLRDAAVAIAGTGFIASVAVYVVLLAVLLDLVQLPWAFHSGVTLERRYGLSTRTAAAWWGDHIKAGGVALGLAILAALVLMSLVTWSPAHWWIGATIVFTAVLVLATQLTPVFLMPLFYDLKPLTRDSLRERLLVLADRAGAPALAVLEWRLSDRTKKANAALAGIGNTRRILVSDTLLADHSDDEIEVIMAHELAHHVHRDILTSLAVEAASIGLGFWVAQWLLSAVGDAVALGNAGDVARLPIILLAIGAVSVAGLPLSNALSRVHERRADRFALALTHNAGAFITAMKRLSAQNLAEEDPSAVVRLLFLTHPPPSARIAAARRWQLEHQGSSLGPTEYDGSVVV